MLFREKYRMQKIQTSLAFKRLMLSLQVMEQYGILARDFKNMNIEWLLGL